MSVLNPGGAGGIIAITRSGTVSSDGLSASSAMFNALRWSAAGSTRVGSCPSPRSVNVKSMPPTYLANPSSEYR